MNELSHDALWMKAKLFINLAMDDVEWRTFDERGLWASIALELLAKAALSRSSPLLIIASSNDASNHLAAVGLMEPHGSPRSITASQLYERCQKAFKPFNAKEAGRIAQCRNDYIHTGTPSLLAIPPEAWWPRFWAQAAILVNALDRSMDDLVGGQRIHTVESHLAKNKQNIQHRTEMLIARASQRYQQYNSGDLPARIANEWINPVSLSAGLRYSASATCPACSANGLLEGEDADSFRCAL
jgi:hypothetical protein